jgi:hypothetical protein
MNAALTSIWSENPTFAGQAAAADGGLCRWLLGVPWSAGPGDGLAGLGVGAGQGATAGAVRPGQAGRRQRTAQALGFPAAGLPGQGQHLRPGQQFAGQRDDLAQYLVGGEALQGQVPQPGVLCAADPVLAAGMPPMSQLEVHELAFVALAAKAVNRCPSRSVNRS